MPQKKQNNLQHPVKASLGFIPKREKIHFHTNISPDLVKLQEMQEFILAWSKLPQLQCRCMTDFNRQNTCETFNNL